MSQKKINQTKVNKYQKTNSATPQITKKSSAEKKTPPATKPD
jgi:hypothetical protein